jgi:hypothetical protein
VTDDSLTNGQRAVSAGQAINAYAQAWRHPAGTKASDADRDPVREQDRLSRLLCALRHHADRVSTLSFHDSLSAARQDAGRPRAGYAQVNAIGAAAGGRALDAYDRVSRAPGAWPAGTVADLQAYAGRQGISFEAAISGLTTALVTDLRHFADRHGIDFEAAVPASSRAYTEQRLREEGPFEVGQEIRSRPGTLLAAAPAAAIFRPVATHQGVVTAFGDAEWHLVRTAARIWDRERSGFPRPYLPDIDDRRVLSDALSEACGLAGTEILRKLTPRIEARAMEIERGVTAAAELGRAHGRARTQPYCDLDIGGDAAALLRAFGETEWMTDANHPYRLALVTTYSEAYLSASEQGPPARPSPRPASRPVTFPSTPASPRRKAERHLPPVRPARSGRDRAPGPHGGARDDRTREDRQHPQGDHTMSSQWTPEAIRALGATTDLPTLGSIFGVSRWRAYQMAHTGEWQQVGIRIVPIGTKYRVAVQSILEVLRHDGAASSGTGNQPSSGPMRAPGNVTDDTITEPSAPAAARGRP